LATNAITIIKIHKEYFANRREFERALELDFVLMKAWYLPFSVFFSGPPGELHAPQCGVPSPLYPEMLELGYLLRGLLLRSRLPLF
jgi:hypothetical protein